MSGSGRSVQTHTEKQFAGRRRLDLSDKDGAKVTTFILKSETASQQRGLLDIRIAQQGRWWTYVTGCRRGQDSLLKHTFNPVSVEMGSVL